MKVEKKNYIIVEEPKFSTIVAEKKEENRKLIKFPCYLFADQATFSGISIFDFRKRLICTYSIEKEGKEEMQEFRHNFKEFLYSLIEEYQIIKMFYEKVYGGVNFEVTSKLLSIQEIFKEVAFGWGIKAYPLQNKKWKSRLAYPEKLRNDVNDKIQVQHHVKRYFPLIDENEHITDSLGMAIAVLYKGAKSIKPIEFSLNKKLPIDLDVYVINEIEELGEILEKRKYTNRIEKGTKLFDYNTKYDIETNFKFILSNYNVIAIAEIPYHRYYGQILLAHDIRPSTIKEGGAIFGIGYKK